jgi:hypothetical protein
MSVGIRKPFSIGMALLWGMAGVLLSPSAPAFAEACPNEQVRAETHSTGLPDCRAYELVSPPNKNGEPPVTNLKTYVSADGARISFSSLGAFGELGSDGTGEGGEYVTARNATGWLTTPINPSATEFREFPPEENAAGTRETLDFDQGLEHTLFLDSRIDAKPVDSRFYIRDVHSGATQEVGPMLSPAAVAAWTEQVAAEQDQLGVLYDGATHDMSHLIFSLSPVASLTFNYLWPGDTTIGGASLYEYVGDNQTEPELIGVKNQTSLAAAAAARHLPHIDEAAELITQCGTVLGYTKIQDSSEDNFNAISSSGESIIFTAKERGCQGAGGVTGEGPPVAEVYARVGRQSTVAISEPTTGPGGDCEQCDESEPKRAAYQGASEDGKKVFFFSEQKMFDGSHGEEGNNLYEYSFDGPSGHKLSFIAPELVPASQFAGGEGESGGVLSVAKDGQRVYFVSADDRLADNVDARGKTALGASETGEGQLDLYVYDTAAKATRFIAPLSASDQGNWAASNFLLKNVENSGAGGRFLLFPSTNNLTPDASGGANQLYLYDAEPTDGAGPTLTRITVGAPGTYMCATTKTTQQGYNCDGNAGAVGASAFDPAYERKAPQHLSGADTASVAPVELSKDGSKVFFESPVGLVPGALNEVCARESFGTCSIAARNVYEWEAGQVHLISDGLDAHTLFGTAATALLGASPSGSNIFITTADALTAEDTDTQVDIYDANADGGYPAPSSPPTCATGCQPAIGSAPVFGTPGTVTAAGNGNLAAPTVKSPISAKPLTRAQKLSKAQKLSRALKACRRNRSKKRRAACEKRARRTYGRSK